MHGVAGGRRRGGVDHAKLGGTIVRTIEIDERANLAEGGRVGGSKISRVGGTSILACCCTVRLRESHYLLAVRPLAGALSRAICCLIHCFCFSVRDSHRETGPETATLEWARGEFPRTSWRLRRLSILPSPLPPLRSVLPDSRARIISRCRSPDSLLSRLKPSPDRRARSFC